MSEFQRSPSKVWWANGFDSPKSQRSFHDVHIFSPQVSSLPYCINEEEHEAVTSFNQEDDHQVEETNQTIIIKSSSSTSSSSSGSEWSNRNNSSSPNSHKSQDSGFSDSELCHNLEPNKSDPTIEQLEKEISPETPEKNINYNREKYSPKKSISAEINDLIETRRNVRSLPSTPEMVRNNRNMDDQQCEFMQPFEPPIFQSTPKLTTAPSTEVRLYKQTISNNLEKNIKNYPTSEVQIKPVEQPKQHHGGSVEQWMTELSKLYEAECMITLQSKSLATHLSRQVAQAATNATFTIKALLAHSKIISSDFQSISRYISDKNPTISSLLLSLHGNLVEFILTYIINSQSSSLVKLDKREMEVHEILDICDRLKRKYTEDLLSYHFEEISLEISRLKSLFRETEKNVLMIQVQLLVNMIEEPSTELALRGAIHGVMWAASSTSTSELLVKCGAIRALLITCVENKKSTIRAAALRTLAVACSTSKAIQQFEEVGGIEIVADILCEMTRPEPELFEAVAVLVQITAPWIDNNEKLRGLKRYAQTLIQSLTRLVNMTKCCQNLLLSAAALANISTMEPTTVWPLLQSHTAECLLSAVQKRGPFASVFLKEQTATLIANMAAAPESRVQLGEGKAAVALLCFLQVRPSVLDDPKSSNEYAACLRLQQKSAVALSRLCNEKMIAEQVVALGGVSQIVRLCKEKRERNHSDAILVAALGALRKIASICGTEIMEEQDVTELIEPRLLDSFLTYSAQNESYV